MELIIMGNGSLANSMVRAYIIKMMETFMLANGSMANAGDLALVVFPTTFVTKAIGSRICRMGMENFSIVTGIFILNMWVNSIVEKKWMKGIIITRMGIC